MCCACSKYTVLMVVLGVSRIHGVLTDVSRIRWVNGRAGHDITASAGEPEIHDVKVELCHEQCCGAGEMSRLRADAV